MIIESDNKAVEKTLTRLTTLITDHGGWLDPALKMVCADHAISVKMAGPNVPGHTIIKMPPALLVPALEMRLRLKRKTFSIIPDKTILTPLQIQVAELMIELYNLTNKAEFHKNESPWFAFRDAPELMDSLLHARTINKNPPPLQQQFMHGVRGTIPADEFLCMDFIMTRVISIARAPDNEKVRHVMPIIDYLNHDYRASGFFTPEQPIARNTSPAKDEDYLRIKNSQPSISSGDCYVSYGIYDALDTLLGYGFMDTEVPLVRSIPLQIPVRGAGDLIVNAFSTGQHAAQVGKELADIAAYMPAVEQTNNGLTASHLLIGLSPGPQLLRRALHSLISTMMGRSASQPAITELVSAAELFVIDRNVQFYLSFLQEIDNYRRAPPRCKNQMRQIANIQLNKLYKYQFEK